MSRPVVLAYCVPEARLSKLRFLCMKLGLLLKPVQAEDFCQPVGALCGVKPRAESEAEKELSVGEMLVFCHMDNGAVNRFLTVQKQLRVPPFPIKAILTPTNADWNAAQLYAELTQERSAITSGEAAHPQENGE